MARCLRRHVTVHRTYLELTVPASKTAQTYRGAVVTVPATFNDICPVAAMRAYLAHTAGRPPGEPLLQRASGAYATIGWLNDVLRSTLPPSAGRVTTHSLRIGFATAAAAAGVHDSAIRAAGRWTGAASHLRYIRGPRLDVWRARLAAARTAD
ncbi:hypothetical protein FJT64_004505 [Amphibalanus amphitrite]|uniref:Tyr recombinase domain-containing protein n=1 Tax=Amphibalanus amphitrite TaxID=1232801 RepID=A0A6A4VTG2_AMPAM|nr:hypothetical protein FJT64_004505 [Amphibalanus amphitrite]